MLFAVDIGNTNVTIGVFEKDNIVTSFRLNTDTNRFAEEYLLSIKQLMVQFSNHLQRDINIYHRQLELEQVILLETFLRY